MAKRAVIIDILSDAKGFAKGSKDAEQAAGGLQGNLQQLGRTIVSTYAAKQVIDFGQQAVKAAVEDAAAQKVLEQALINATGATADQVAATEDWITQTQLAKGVADTELRPALATLVGATKDVQEAQDLMGLAMDTARAKGVSLETAATAIAKAHDGNTTSLLKLVPGLKEAGDKSLDFATATQRLNEQVKGQADAWAQTDEGKLERMNLQWGEMQEQIGGALLPVMGKLIGIVSSVFDWFNSLDEGTQDLIVTVGLVAGGLYVAVSGFNAVKTAVEGLGLKAAQVNPWIAGIGLALTAVVAVVELFSDEESAAEQTTRDFTKAVRDSSSRVDLQRLAFLDAADAAKEFNKAVFEMHDAEVHDRVAGDEAMVAAMNHFGVSMDSVIAATHSAAAAQAILNSTHTTQYVKAYNAATQEQRDGMSALVDMMFQYGAAGDETTRMQVELAKTGDIIAITFLKSTGQLDLLTESQRAAAEAALDAAAASKDSASGIEDLGDETEVTFGRMQLLVDTTDELRKAFDKIIGPSMDLESAQRAVADAAQNTTDTLVENGATLDINTAAGRANREAIQSQAEAALAQAEAMVKNGSTTAEATRFADNYRESLRTQLQMLGLTTEQIDGYLTTLGLTPENVTTVIATANADTTKAQLEDLLKQMDGVDKGAIAEIQADIDNGQFEEATRKINELPGHHTVLVGLKSDGAGLRISGQGADFSGTPAPAAARSPPACRTSSARSGPRCSCRTCPATSCRGCPSRSAVAAPAIPPVSAAGVLS